MVFASYEVTGIGEACDPSMHIGFGKIKIELGEIKAKIDRQAVCSTPPNNRPASFGREARDDRG
jgi:hypothetical protein